MFNKKSKARIAELEAVNQELSQKVVKLEAQNKALSHTLDQLCLPPK